MQTSISFVNTVFHNKKWHSQQGTKRRFRGWKQQHIHTNYNVSRILALHNLSSIRKQHNISKKRISNTKKENLLYKCFNNNNIDIKGLLIIDIESASTSAKACRVLIVNSKTNNIMGRDLLSKLGITLNATKNVGMKINLITQLQTEKNIIKWVFQKHPHLCTCLGRSKNNIAKSIIKSEYTPS